MTRLHLLPAGLLASLLALTLTLTLLHSPAELVAAIAAVAVVVLLLTAAPTVQAAPAWVRSLSLRDKALRTAFMRLRDPDAAGRPRPRAPGLAS